MDGERIGIGRVAEVFARDGLAEKRFVAGYPKRNAFREAANLAIVQALGLPAPSVVGAHEVEGRWAIVMTRAAGRPFAEAMLADDSSVPQHLAALARLQAAIHAQSAPALPSLRVRLRHNIEVAEGLTPKRRSRLLAQLEALPDADRVCHGDFHPYNVLGTPDAATVIDWLDAAAGDPAADVCRAYLLLKSAYSMLSDAYVAAYCAETGMDRNTIMAWLPVVAAARLAENAGDAAALLAMIGED